jgi:translation initiation factor IF-1
MANKLKPGDQVRWNTSQGETRGKIARRLTSKTRVKGHVAKPDTEHPQYLVESDKSGARAAHRPGKLRKG